LEDRYLYLKPLTAPYHDAGSWFTTVKVYDILVFY